MTYNSDNLDSIEFLSESLLQSVADSIEPLPLRMRHNLMDSIEPVHLGLVQSVADSFDPLPLRMRHNLMDSIELLAQNQQLVANSLAASLYVFNEFEDSVEFIAELDYDFAEDPFEQFDRSVSKSRDVPEFLSDELVITITHWLCQVAAGFLITETFDQIGVQLFLFAAYLYYEFA